MSFQKEVLNLVPNKWIFLIEHAVEFMLNNIGADVLKYAACGLSEEKNGWYRCGRPVEFPQTKFLVICDKAHLRADAIINEESGWKDIKNYSFHARVYEVKNLSVNFSKPKGIDYNITFGFEDTVIVGEEIYEAGDLFTDKDGMVYALAHFYRENKWGLYDLMSMNTKFVKSIEAISNMKFEGNMREMYE